MTTITITLSDAADGKAAVVETTAAPPAVGAPLTPSQALAVDALRVCKAQAREVRYVLPAAPGGIDRTIAPRPLIIGLCGPAGAGKDTVAAILRAHAGFHCMAFADALREEVCNAYGIERLYLTRRELKDSPQTYLALSRCADQEFVRVVRIGHLMSPMDEFMAAPRSPREIMQWWGTEYRRAKRATYWLDQVAMSIQNLNRTQLQRTFAITDVRFENEAQTVRRLGGWIWQVKRPGAVATGGHASDVSGAEFSPDLCIDNHGDLQQLVDQVAAAYRRAEVANTRGATA